MHNCKMRSPTWQMCNCEPIPQRTSRVLGRSDDSADSLNAYHVPKHYCRRKGNFCRDKGINCWGNCLNTGWEIQRVSAAMVLALFLGIFRPRQQKDHLRLHITAPDFLCLIQNNFLIQNAQIYLVHDMLSILILWKNNLLSILIFIIRRMRRHRKHGIE